MIARHLRFAVYQRRLHYLVQTPVFARVLGGEKSLCHKCVTCYALYVRLLLGFCANCQEGNCIFPCCCRLRIAAAIPGRANPLLISERACCLRARAFAAAVRVPCVRTKAYRSAPHIHPWLRGRRSDARNPVPGVPKTERNQKRPRGPAKRMLLCSKNCVRMLWFLEQPLLDR